MVERQPPGRPSRARAALAGAAAAVALVAVALASRAGSHAPSRPPGFSVLSSAASSSATVVALVVLPIAAIGGLVALVVLQVFARRRKEDLVAAGLHHRPSRIARVAALVTTGVIVYLVHRGIVHLPGISLARLTAHFGSGGHSPGSDHGRRAAAGTSISTGQWIAATVCWLLLGVAGVAGWRRLRKRPVATAVVTAEPPVEPAPLFGSIADVRAEPDPTRAVIGAYALMERLLRARGAGRHTAEAPIEYLGRVGRELPVTAPPAGRLTRLFLRARFAGTGVGPRAKAEALTALEQLEDGEP